MRCRVYIGTILNLDSVVGILGQSPELSLDIILGYDRIAKRPCDFASRALHRMLCPPVFRKGIISGLERRYRVILAFVEAVAVSLSEDARSTVPLLVRRHKR